MEVDLGAVLQARTEDVVTVAQRRRPEPPFLREGEGSRGNPKHRPRSTPEAGAIERHDVIDDYEGERQDQIGSAAS